MASILKEEQKNILLGYSRWANFLSIVGIVMGAGIVLIGVPLILLLGLGIIYIAFGALYIWLCLKLKKSGKSLKAIAEDEEITGLSYIEKTISAVDNLRTIFKVLGIVTIIQLVFVGITILFTIGSIFSGVSQLGEVSDSNDDSGSSIFFNVEE